MNYHVTVNERGLPEAFYNEAIHESIPEHALPISEAQWQQLISHQGKYKFVNGVMTERTQAEIDEELAARPPRPPGMQEQIDELTLALADIYAGGIV